jgi:hypothetical protein
MFKPKLLAAGLFSAVLFTTSANAQTQLGAFQIWGNPTSSGAPSKPSNVGSFLTQGTGITITGTPKATIGLANQITAAGPMGSATQTPVITYNAQGQLTVVTLATIAPPFSAVTGQATLAQLPTATTAQYRNNTASLLLTTDQVWAAGAVVPLTDAATVTPDFSTGFNFTWTLGAAGRTLATPTNIKVGQTGVIQLIQDATGSRTITTWGTAWKFSGGTKPTLTTTANAVDILTYACYSTGACAATFIANVQ